MGVSSRSVSLLQANYDPHLKSVTARSLGNSMDDLEKQLEADAVAAGVTPGSIDWSTWLPALFAAVTSKNWLTVAMMMVQLAPTALAFIQQVIAVFHQVTPAPAPTPSVTQG